MKHSFTLHKKLYVLLNQCKLMEQRHEMVFSFTNGRTENSSDMTSSEVEAMINHLQQFSQANAGNAMSDFVLGDAMRKRILSLCHQYGLTTFDTTKVKEVVDFKALNTWMVKYSYLHKPMNEYSYKELPALVTQFEQVVKSYLHTL